MAPDDREPQLSRAAGRYDEDSVRVRPGRGSRPRTRQRPRHADAVAGFVLTVDRGRYTCLVDDRRVLAMKAPELGRRSIVVGDKVHLVGDVSGARDTLARIVRIQPRVSALRRTADDTDPVERVIVANADQLAVVASLADPPPRLRLIDRCLVAAHDAGMDALLCLTKADLATPDAVLATYAPLGIPSAVTRRGESSTELRELLARRVSVLVGQSGVGKSTLVNALVPGAERATGVVSAVTGKGRHISSSAIAFRLGEGGWIVDTPGVRSFGLAHVPDERLLEAFPELEEGTGRCPRGCDHLEDDCALDSWVARGHADAARLDSLRRLLRSRESE